MGGGQIHKITGDFIRNYADSSSGSVTGGVVYLGGSGNTEITGNFVENYALSHSGGYGGMVNASGSTLTLNGNFIRNYVISTNSYFNGGMIYVGGGGLNVTGDFVGNYVSGPNIYGGTLFSGGSLLNVKGSFIDNYASGSDVIYGGAAYIGGNSFEVSGDFIRNYALGVSNTLGSSDVKGGAIYAGYSTTGILNSNFIGNYAKSVVLSGDEAKALGGAIYLEGGTLRFIPLANKGIVFENNKVITKVGNSAEISTLNSINFADSNSIVNFDTAANTYINIGDPMTSFDSAGTQGNFGTINKSGAGSLYLWGDNSEYEGDFNVNGGTFYAMFEDKQDLVNDPLGQRLSFDLSNAVVLFADGTIFKPKVTNGQIANIGNS
ncbi:MAG: hypothetical protein ACK5N8_01935, partial [Alphaproteobacteria bacterium]